MGHTPVGEERIYLAYINELYIDVQNHDLKSHDNDPHRLLRTWLIIFWILDQIGYPYKPDPLKLAQNSNSTPDMSRSKLTMNTFNKGGYLRVSVVGHYGHVYSICLFIC